MDYRLKNLYENMLAAKKANPYKSSTLSNVYERMYQTSSNKEPLSEDAVLAEQFVFEDDELLEEGRYADGKWVPERHIPRIQAAVNDAIQNGTTLQYCNTKNCEEPSSFTPTKNAGDPSIIITDKNSKISGIGENGEQVSVSVKDLLKDNKPNKGEVAEGILGTALFLRFIRPDEVSADSIISFITDVLTDHKTRDDKGNSAISVKVTGSKPHVLEDSAVIEFADEFKLLIKLKKRAMEGFLDREFLSGPMAKLIKGIAHFANIRVKKYSNYFRKNKKADSIAIKSDGVSGEGALKPKEGESSSEEDISKTDVEVFVNQETKDENGNIKTIKRVLKHLNLSVKVGSTKQIGQHGGLGKDSSLGERFDKTVSFWQRFGIDVTPIKSTFVEQQDIISAYDALYTFAAQQMNNKFNMLSDQGDIELITKLGKALQFYGSANKKDLSLIQFTDKGGFFMLDFNKLGRLLEKDIINYYNFGARVVRDENGLPKLEIVNTKDATLPIESVGKNNIFISIRMYRTSDGYVRNYVEKGAGLIKLLKVKEWEDKIEKSPNQVKAEKQTKVKQKEISAEEDKTIDEIE